MLDVLEVKRFYYLLEDNSFTIFVFVIQLNLLRKNKLLQILPDHSVAHVEVKTSGSL